VLRTTPDSSVHRIVTSPPYVGLRDYCVAVQVGVEKTLDEHIDLRVATEARPKCVRNSVSLPKPDQVTVA